DHADAEGEIAGAERAGQELGPRLPGEITPHPGPQRHGRGQQGDGTDGDATPGHGPGQLTSLTLLHDGDPTAHPRFIRSRSSASRSRTAWRPSARAVRISPALRPAVSVDRLAA